MNTQIRKMQQGFTLIELMIVVAIIGILAAIALPAYQDYTARAQMSEAMTLMGGAKTAYAEYRMQQGSAPADNAAAGLAAAASITGKYVASVDVSSGAVVATMKGAGSVAPPIAAATLTLTPTFPGGAVKWTCTSSASAKYLPSACK